MTKSLQIIFKYLEIRPICNFFADRSFLFNFLVLLSKQLNIFYSVYRAAYTKQFTIEHKVVSLSLACGIILS